MNNQKSCDKQATSSYSGLLDFKYAPYGKKIFSTLSRKLAVQYGRSFQEERQNGENTPIGIILCTEVSRSQIELLEMELLPILLRQTMILLMGVMYEERSCPF
jgi:hypothetical protein